MSRVLFHGSGRFTADGFVEFLDKLRDAIWRPDAPGEGATALDAEQDSRMEFAPGVEFVRTYLFIKREEDWKPIELQFLVGNCTARVPLSDIREVSVKVVLVETNRYGGARLALGLCIAKTDDRRFQGQIVYRLRARKTARQYIASALAVMLAPVAQAAC